MGLISGGPEHWLGVSSEAFQAAWDERRARLQQISQILSQSAQHFTQFAQTIEDNLPTIRADQAVMQESASHMLGVDDQASLLNEESQAQNAIVTALAALNAQLEALAEEVKDCPQEQRGDNGPYGINRSGNGAGSGAKDGSSDSEGGSRVTPEGRLLTSHTDESLPRHRMTPAQVDDVIDNYTYKTEQRDTATVYIKKQAGRGQKFSIVIEGDNGIVTAVRDLERRDLDNLGRRYGFTYNP